MKIQKFQEFINESTDDKIVVRNSISKILYDRFNKKYNIEDLEEDDLEKFAKFLSDDSDEHYSIVLDYVKCVYEGTWYLFTLTCA